MKDESLRLNITLLLAAVAFGSVPRPGIGQAQSPYRITVALVRALDRPDASAVVVHRPGHDPADMILLGPNANPADLVAGLNTQRRIRSDLEPKRIVIRITSGTPPQTAEHAQLAAALLRRLRTAPLREIGGVGRVRAEDVMVERGRLISGPGSQSPAGTEPLNPAYRQ